MAVFDRVPPPDEDNLVRSKRANLIGWLFRKATDQDFSLTEFFVIACSTALFWEIVRLASTQGFLRPYAIAIDYAIAIVPFFVGATAYWLAEKSGRLPGWLGTQYTIITSINGGRALWNLLVTLVGGSSPQ